MVKNINTKYKLWRLHMKKVFLFIFTILLLIGVVKAEELNEYVVRIDNKYYTSISTAIDEAKDKDIVVFIKGNKLFSKLSVPKGKNIIFDLNNKTLELADIKDNYALVIGGTLSIKGNGKIIIPGLYGIGVQSSGNLVIENGTFNQATGDYLIGNWGNTHIYDGTFNANYSAVNGFGGKVIIDDGEFIGNDWPLVVGNVIINNGLFNKDVSYYLSSNSALLTLKIDNKDIDDYMILVVEKGSFIEGERLSSELINLQNNFIPKDYELVGYYKDKELTSRFNFDTEIKDDMTLFLELVPNTKEMPPKTSDKNIYLLVVIIITCAIGIVIIFKEKLYR